MADIQIGTSGWNYEHREELFYQEDLSNTDCLNHYKGPFNNAEVNNTFYNP